MSSRPADASGQPSSALVTGRAAMPAPMMAFDRMTVLLRKLSAASGASSTVSGAASEGCLRPAAVRSQLLACSVCSALGTCAGAAALGLQWLGYAVPCLLSLMFLLAVTSLQLHAPAGAEPVCLALTSGKQRGLHVRSCLRHSVAIEQSGPEVSACHSPDQPVVGTPVGADSTTQRMCSGPGLLTTGMQCALRQATILKPAALEHALGGV